MPYHTSLLTVVLGLNRKEVCKPPAAAAAGRTLGCGMGAAAAAAAGLRCLLTCSWYCLSWGDWTDVSCVGELVNQAWCSRFSFDLSGSQPRSPDQNPTCCSGELKFSTVFSVTVPSGLAEVTRRKQKPGDKTVQQKNSRWRKKYQW